MAKNWAVVIGVNNYTFLDSLEYAQRDAKIMANFLRHKAGFDRVWLFSDGLKDKTRQPTRAALRHYFNNLGANKLAEEDNFWFFFSGHGWVNNDHDYLMLSDGNPDDIEDTAIPLSFVMDRLRNCNAGNILLFLDACRATGQKNGIGIGEETTQQALQKQIIIFFSCQKDQHSYEIKALKHGSFTYALLEGLKDKSKSSTVQSLERYLKSRVIELNTKYNKSLQNPCVIAEIYDKSNLVLFPHRINEQHKNNGNNGEIKIHQNKRRINENLILWTIVIVIPVLTALENYRFQELKKETEKLAKKQEKYFSIVCTNNQKLDPQFKDICTPENKTPQNYRELSEFICANIYGTPTTIAVLSNGSKRQFIRWKSELESYSPERRCNEVTSRLNKVLKKGGVYITTGLVNRRQVICVTDRKGQGCQELLFTVPKGRDSQEILEYLFTFQDNNLSSIPLKL